MAEVLDDDEVEQQVPGGWEQVGDEIVRVYEFDNYLDAASFLTDLAEVADEEFHHPEITLRYDEVRSTSRPTRPVASRRRISGWPISVSPNTEGPAREGSGSRALHGGRADGGMTAAYVFDAAFRVEAPEISLTPNRFETTLRLFAPPPGASGEQIDWLFFRDRLWSGAISDEAPLRRAVSDWLDVELLELAFAELRTDEAYLEALKAAVAEDLTRFNAESVDAALQQYLGSSIHVVDTEAV